MRYAVSSMTSYQFLNEINLIYNVLGTENNTFDLFYTDNAFLMDSSKIELLKQYNIFENMYKWEERLKNSPHKVVRGIGNVFEIYIPPVFLSIATGKKIQSFIKSYDAIIFASADGNGLECLLCNIYKNAELIAVEDGTGSYLGDIINREPIKCNPLWYSKRKKIIEAMRRPSSLWVNDKGSCKSTTADNILQLPIWKNTSEKYRSMVRKIFFDEESTKHYRDHRIVYLEQNDISEKEQQEVLGALSCYAEQCILRMHPWFRRDNLDYCLATDDSSCMWEMICEKYIRDDSVLVNVCSTSSITPKIIFDREPVIIYTYRMYNMSADGHQFGDFFVNMMRKRYNHPERIYAPRNVHELEDILKAVAVNGIVE